MSPDDEATEDRDLHNDEKVAIDRSFDPYEGINDWSFDDRLPGDGRVRRALTYLTEHVASPESAEPVILRALGDAMEGRVWSEVTLAELDDLDRRVRLGVAPEADARREFGTLYSSDPARVEALWQIETLRATLVEVQRALLARGTDAQTVASHIRLVDRLAVVLAGGISAADESRTATKRTFVLNAFAAVAGLRLPAVVRHLAATGVFDRGRLNVFLRPLEGEDVECVLAIVRARYPEIAHRLDEEAGADGLIRQAIDNYRQPSSGGRRWTLLISLLDVAGLWKEAAVTRASPSDADAVRKKDETNLRTTYSKDPDSLGDLEQPRIRMRAWERFAAFTLAVGLGAPTAMQLEAALAEVVASEVNR